MEGRQSRLEPREESLGLMALGKELKGQPPGFLCSVIPHTLEAIILGQSKLLHAVLALG